MKDFFMDEVKPWFASRTIRWAAVIAVLGAIEASLPQFKELIPEVAYGPLLGVVAVLMVYLRVTHKPV